MSSFFDEQGGTRVCGEAYMGYVAAGDPRTTPLIEKGAIYGWTPSKTTGRDWLRLGMEW